MGRKAFVGLPGEMADPGFIRASVSENGMDSDRGRSLAPTFTSIGECTLFHMGDYASDAGEGMGLCK